jgi:hypothetical protein
MDVSSWGGAARKRANHPDVSSGDTIGGALSTGASVADSVIGDPGDSSSGVSARNRPSQSPDLSAGAGADSAGAAGRRRSACSFSGTAALGALASVFAAGAGGSLGLAGSDNPLIGIGGGVFSETGATVSGARRAPHLLQNTLSTVLGVPHIGQTKPDCCTKRAPQSLQNLLPSRFFVPQCAH